MEKTGKVVVTVMNKVASAIKVIGQLTLVISIFGSVVLGFLSDDALTGWTIFLTYAFLSVMAGAVLIGFAEVIELLEKIKNKVSQPDYRPVKGGHINEISQPGHRPVRGNHIAPADTDDGCEPFSVTDYLRLEKKILESGDNEEVCLQYCVQALKMLPGFISYCANTNNDAPTEILCRDYAIEIYKELGDFESAKKVIALCAECGAYTDTEARIALSGIE